MLSKRQIQSVASRYKVDPEIQRIADMACGYRDALKASRKAKQRKPKEYLKPTDYLSLSQFTGILEVLSRDVENSKAHNGKINRAVVNEMIVILLVETGLRASELCNLKLKDLPSHHSKPEIFVRQGKGKKDRTVVISDYLAEKLINYVQKYKKGQSLDNWLFVSEQRKRMTYNALYAKVKGIGLKAGIWVYNKGKKKKTRLSPHKFRHTFGTYLLNVAGNEILVQNQLGHCKPETTAIYAKTLTETSKKAMQNLHIELWKGFLKKE